MSEETKDTAPVETTETAPETTVTETEATEQSTQEVKKEEAKPSLLAALKALTPAEKSKWLEKYKDDQSAFNGIMSAQEMLGKKGDIPKEDSDESVFKEFWGKLGADKIELTTPDLSTLGGNTEELSEYYKGISGKLGEIAKEVVPSAKNIPDMLNKVFSRFAEEDAKAQIEAAKEQEKINNQLIGDLVKKTGIPKDEISRMSEEVVSRYGWNENTTKYEVFMELAKATTNSSTMQDAYLHNTNEGLQNQIDEISRSDEYLRMDGPKHTAAVSKVTELLKRQQELKKKN